MYYLISHTYTQRSTVPFSYTYCSYFRHISLFFPTKKGHQLASPIIHKSVSSSYPILLLIPFQMLCNRFQKLRDSNLHFICIYIRTPHTYQHLSYNLIVQLNASAVILIARRVSSSDSYFFPDITI